MNEPFIGSIVLFCGNFAPRGWALCNGQLMSISQNTALFSILGTTFGGDGITTFGLPDLRGRVPMHPGNGPGLSPRILGELAGNENVSLLINNMPSHNHMVNATTTVSPSRGGTSPTNNLLGVTAAIGTNSVDIYVNDTPKTTMSQQMIANNGGNVPFGIVQPFLCINFIIALQGIFPSRN